MWYAGFLLVIVPAMLVITHLMFEGRMPREIKIAWLALLMPILLLRLRPLEHFVWVWSGLFGTLFLVSMIWAVRLRKRRIW